MSNIEPTEEQWRAANNIADGQYRAVCKIADVAHLLAEREAKLEEHIKWLETQCVSFEDANINNQKTIKALNEENQRYCEQVAIEKRHWSNLNKHNEKTEAEAATLRARVVELERPNWLTTPTRSTRPRKDRLKEAHEREKALTKRVAELETRPQFASVSSDGFIATSTGPVHVDDVGSVQDALEKRVAELEASEADAQQELQMALDDWNSMVRAIQAPAHGTAIAHAKLLVQREAQHLADIKALHAAIDAYVNDEDEDRAVTFDALRTVRARLAHYDDAKADAPAFPTDMQHCFTVEKVDAGAVDWRACVKPTAEGGAR